MSTRSQSQKVGGWLWNRLPAAALCVAILCSGLPAGAETLLGTPVERPDAVPISPARGKRTTGTVSTPESSFTRTGAGLAVVVVGIGLALTLARKVFPGLAPDSAHRIIHVLGQSPLGTKGTVYIVRCGPRVLIVGGTTGQLTTLAEIADPDEIDEFVRLSGTNAPGSRHPRPESTDGAAPTRQLKGQVDGMLDRIDSWKVSD